MTNVLLKHCLFSLQISTILQNKLLVAFHQLRSFQQLGSLAFQCRAFINFVKHTMQILLKTYAKPHLIAPF